MSVLFGTDKKTTYKLTSLLIHVATPPHFIWDISDKHPGYS